MNHAITSQTRWSCRMARRWTSIGHEGSEPTGLAARHVAGCTDCQRYFVATSEVETSLRRNIPRAEVPVGLELRIMNAIERKETVAPARRARLSFAPLLAGAAVAALAVLFTLPRLSESPQGDGTVAIPRPVIPPRTPETGAEASAASTSWTALTAPVTTALSENSLQDEADAVYADTRSAVGFLAMNFLPSGTLANATTSVPQGNRGGG